MCVCVCVCVRVGVRACACVREVTCTRLPPAQGSKDDADKPCFCSISSLISSCKRARGEEGEGDGEGER
jgi:hypothetical protein